MCWRASGCSSFPLMVSSLYPCACSHCWAALARASSAAYLNTRIIVRECGSVSGFNPRTNNHTMPSILARRWKTLLALSATLATGAMLTVIVLAITGEWATLRRVRALIGVEELTWWALGYAVVLVFMLWLSLDSLVRHRGERLPATKEISERHPHLSLRVAGLRAVAPTTWRVLDDDALRTLATWALFVAVAPPLLQWSVLGVSLLALELEAAGAPVWFDWLRSRSLFMATFCWAFIVIQFAIAFRLILTLRAETRL